MNREQKVELVSKIKQDLLDSNLIVLLHYRGLTDNQLYNFRNSLKDKNASLRVAKNTLIKIAIKDTKLDVLNPYLSGPTAIAYGEDAASLAKVTMETAKEHKPLKVQTGYLNNAILSEDSIKSLSKLGSLEEVRTAFLGKLKAAQSKFVQTLNAPASNIVALMNNYASSKKEEG